MNCLQPVLIKNRYTDKYMFVPCGNCDGCLCQKSVSHSAALSNDMLNYDINLFVTLTYDNCNIPFIINGYSGIYRLDKNGFITTIEETEDLYNLRSFVPIRHFDNVLSTSDKMIFGSENCIGVIYYRDVQLLFKRLRKHINFSYGKTSSNFRYYIASEYGSVYQRPHFHIIFQFQERRIANFVARILPQCWTMCDWSRQTELIKFATSGISSYVSSYVNSSACHCEVSRIKRFRPFQKRSKNLSFGIDKDYVKKVTTIIERNFGEDFYDFNFEDFTIMQQKTLGHVSIIPLPKNLFNRYFSKCKGFGNLSFDSFRLQCYSVYGYYQKHGFNFGLSNYASVRFETDNQFRTLILRYYNFINDFNYDDSFATFDKYVSLCYHFLHFYDMVLIRQSMMVSENMSNSDYLLYCYNTFSPKVSKYKRNIILRSLGLPIDFISPLNFYVKKEEIMIKDRIYKYRNFLLPKHFNSLVNKL